MFPQILEAVTMQHIFMNNFQLCSEINERVVQHFVHCTETHGRHVQYLKFLQTIVKAENKFIKKCQDIVMAEVGGIRPAWSIGGAFIGECVQMMCACGFFYLFCNWRYAVCC